MRRLLAFFVFISSITVASYSYALLNLELTRGMAGAVPIAIVPFEMQGEMPTQNVSDIISSDLQMSGRFKVYGKNKLPGYPHTLSQVKLNEFQKLAVDNIVIGKVHDVGNGRYEVNFQLLDVYKGKETPQQSVLLTQKFVVPDNQLRSLAHHISDLIYQQITGVRGIFSTRLAYIVVQRGPAEQVRYILEVSDVDGYNPRALLTSPDPVMSPAWSPDGRQIAYVSFEKKHAAIFIQDVVTGARRLVTNYNGINGAPAWSPDGNKLAIVLSKDGSPNIYILNLITHSLTQVTHDLSINTEPSWAPDGKSIIFTSNRGGGPQIYQKNLATGAISRVTYDGDYNARASFAKDGTHIVVLNKESNVFNIGILDLNTGAFRVLTHSGADNESPTIAPNSSMVLYGEFYKGRTLLGMVSTDGGVQLRIPARNGDVQDPAWSPFLS